MQNLCKGEDYMEKKARIDKNVLYIDFTGIKIPSWKIREAQKIKTKLIRDRRRIDPFFSMGYSKRKYKTATELWYYCEEYFKSKQYVLTTKEGIPRKNPETGEYLYGTLPLTMSGLARHLGVSTSTLIWYERKAEAGKLPYEFKEVIQDAKHRIEEYAETRLYDRDGNRGAEFMLSRSFRWRTPLEDSMIVKNEVETKLQQEKWKKVAEKMDLENRVLRESLSETEAGNVHIVIERAEKPLYTK